MREYFVGVGINGKVSRRKSFCCWDQTSCGDGRSRYVRKLDILLVGGRACFECGQSIQRIIDQHRVDRIRELDSDGYKLCDMADCWTAGGLFIL